MLFAIFQNRIIYTNINQNREKSILRKPHQIIILQRKAIATHNNTQTAYTATLRQQKKYSCLFLPKEKQN